MNGGSEQLLFRFNFGLIKDYNIDPIVASRPLTVPQFSLPLGAVRNWFMSTSPSRYTALWTALSLAWDLGYMIALPLVILALVGRWLDHKWNSSPLMLLVGVVVAFTLSSVWLASKMKEITKEMKDQK